VLELLLLALLVIVEVVADEDVVGLPTEVEESTELVEVLTVTEVLEEEVTLTVDEDEDDAVVGLTVMVVFESAGMESGIVGRLVEIVAGIVGSVIGREVDRLLVDEVLTELELAEVDDVIFVDVVFAAAGNLGQYDDISRMKPEEFGICGIELDGRKDGLTQSCYHGMAENGKRNCVRGDGLHVGCLGRKGRCVKYRIPELFRSEKSTECADRILW
jgi:hypothetical protein